MRIWNKYELEDDDYMANNDLLLVCSQESLNEWFRKKHGYHIVVLPTVNSYWTYKIIRIFCDKDFENEKFEVEQPPYKDVCGKDFETYEDAMSDAQLEVLNNYIK